MRTAIQAQARGATAPAFIPAVSPARRGLLQRQCACGGAPGVDGECAACRDERLALQRRAAPGAVPAAVPAVVYQVLRAPGRPLEPPARAFMGTCFGHDFSRVRVHTDAPAAESAQAVRAQAYTVGGHIVFGAGRYDPATPAGQRLLAHELAHVVQQRGADLDPPGAASLEVDPADSAREREAHAAAADVAAADPPPVSETGLEPGRLNRQPADEGEEKLSLPAPSLGRLGEPLPYREAMETTLRGVYEDYVRDCTGAPRMLSRLSRVKLSPLERMRGLEKRLEVLPRLFKMKRAIEQEKDATKRLINLKNFQETNVEGDFPRFPRGYQLSSEPVELAITRCELSEARWEFFSAMMPGGSPGTGSSLRKQP